MKRLVNFLLLLLLPLAILAQTATVSGTVTDARTGETLLACVLALSPSLLSAQSIAMSLVREVSSGKRSEHSASNAARCLADWTYG